MKKRMWGGNKVCVCRDVWRKTHPRYIYAILINKNPLGKSGNRNYPNVSLMVNS